MAVVVQVAKAEGAGAKVVLAVVFCALAGGDKAAVELGMGSDTDLIAVVAGIEAALFGNAPVVGIQLALAVMAVNAYAVTGADLYAAALLPALVGGGVLYAFDGEVLYIGTDAFAGDLGASEGGVAAALEDGLAVFVANVAVAVAFACAMAVAVSGLAAGTDAYVRCAVISCGHADIPTAALMAALFVLTEGGRLQQDAVVGGQQGAAGTLNVRTGHGDVRCLSRSGSVQAGFATGVNAALLDAAKVAADFAAVLLLPVANGEAEVGGVQQPAAFVTVDQLVGLPAGIGGGHGIGAPVTALSDGAGALIQVLGGLQRADVEGDGQPFLLVGVDVLVAVAVINGAAGMRSSRGNKDRGRKDNDGTGCFMGGFIGMGQGRRVKSSLHFVPLIKVQAAFGKYVQAISIQTQTFDQLKSQQKERTS